MGNSVSESAFEIKPTLANGVLYYEVFYKGLFWESADTVSEARRDIKRAVITGNL